jgi:hypothetical protein
MLRGRQSSGFIGIVSGADAWEDADTAPLAICRAALAALDAEATP